MIIIEIVIFKGNITLSLNHSQYENHTIIFPDPPTQYAQNRHGAKGAGVSSSCEPAVNLPPDALESPSRCEPGSNSCM